MSIKKLLQGQWLGHPLHPALVHLPTGLWLSALMFDVLSRVVHASQVAAATTASCAAIALGLLVALAAVPTGIADWWEIKPEKPAYKLSVWHILLNATVFALFAINLGWRWSMPLEQRLGAGPLALTAIAAALLAVSGYLGGRMVFDHGIGIARQSKKQWRRIAEEGGANLPAEDGSP